MLVVNATEVELSALHFKLPETKKGSIEVMNITDSLNSLVAYVLCLIFLFTVIRFQVRDRVASTGYSIVIWVQGDKDIMETAYLFHLLLTGIETTQNLRVIFTSEAEKEMALSVGCAIGRSLFQETLICCTASDSYGAFILEEGKVYPLSVYKKSTEITTSAVKADFLDAASVEVLSKAIQKPNVIVCSNFATRLIYVKIPHSVKESDLTAVSVSIWEPNKGHSLGLYFSHVGLT